MKYWKIIFIVLGAVEEYVAPKDASIHSKCYQKTQQKDHLNNRMYNLLRWKEMRTAKARP